MKRAIFREDRKIYVNGRLSKALLATVRKTKYPYDVLIFDGNSSYNSIEDLLQIGQHLRSSVKEIRFLEYNNYQYYHILREMRSIEAITLKHTNLRSVVEIFESLKDPNFFLAYLKTLKLWVYCCIPESMKEEIDSIKQFIPKDAQITLTAHHVELRFGKTVPTFAFNVDKVLINRLCIDSLRLKAQVEILLEIDNLECERIEFRDSQDRVAYQYLKAFSNNHKNVKHFKVTTSFLPPPMNLSQVTDLTLTPNGSISSLEPFEYLTHLQKLKIDSEMGKCGFGHVRISLVNLISFETSMRVSCTECLNALTNSFPNLKEVNIKVGSWSAIMNNKWQWLETMKVDVDKLELNVNDSPRHYLRNLTLRSRFKLTITDEDLRNISKLFPKLQFLNLYSANMVETKPSSKTLVDVAFSVFPKFVKLEIYSRV